MARESTWTNADGLVVGFGARDSLNVEAGTIRTMGNVEILVMELNYDALPTTGAASEKDFGLPANAVIHRSTLRVIEAFTAAGSATLSIGLKESNGDAIDADGLDATIAVASLTDGAVISGDGALVGESIGADDGYIYTTVAVGPMLTGKAILEIEYSRPLPDSEPTDPIDEIVGSL